MSTDSAHDDSKLEVTPAAALAGLTANAVLVDVREPSETAEGRAKDSLCIPLGDLPERLAELSPDQTVYTMCRSGGRSLRAAKYLAAQGFTKVYSVQGGFTRWKSEGHPSE